MFRRERTVFVGKVYTWELYQDIESEDKSVAVILKQTWIKSVENFGNYDFLKIWNWIWLGLGFVAATAKVPRALCVQTNVLDLIRFSSVKN